MHTSALDLALSITAATILGALLLLIACKLIGKVRLSISVAFWTSVLVQAIGAVISLVLGFVLSSHMTAALILTLGISFLVQAAVFEGAAMASGQKLSPAKAHIIALFYIGVGLFVASPLVSLILG